jgi:hypothetical protein
VVHGQGYPTPRGAVIDGHGANGGTVNKEGRRKNFEKNYHCATSPTANHFEVTRD